ncbi:U3 small nucleolar RNA-associated protein 19 [Angomonas deanei]|nr:U3 small nucleolar RNA-associated protein 19 [Angomonas deanei]|eukprot:EPY42889.1 U3 small nucleolar RNA-associated protein 19 [Angomonas deanei]
MDALFQKALARCDTCKTYAELSSAFDKHARPVIEKVLTTPLVKLVRENTVPDESAPSAAALRTYLETDTEIGDDVWFFTLKCINSVLEYYAKAVSGPSRKRSRDGTEDGFNTVITNTFVLVCNRSIPDLGALSLRWTFLSQEKKAYESSDAYVHSNTAERRKMLLHSVLSVFSERAHKHFFTAVWMHLIKSAPKATLHIHLLHRLGSFVLTNLTTPLVVADYLTGCFNSGGLISILALHGLFILMLDHGLEYPQYYEQLYSLITADTFSSRHRYDLFRLLHLSLTSLRIPVYIVASVIKKVCRVALLSPAPVLYFVLPFVRKLLQSHPNCLALIHRSTKEAVVPGEETEDKSKEELLRALKEAQKKTAELFDGKDPFDPAAPLHASNALNSTLWELTALERHFLPNVPLMVSSYPATAEDDGAASVGYGKRTVPSRPFVRPAGYGVPGYPGTPGPPPVNPVKP